MKYTRINEIKLATILLLEKIKDMYSFDFSNDARIYTKEEEELHSHSINEFVIIDGTTYKIEHAIFENVLSKLASDGMIKLVNHMPISIVELIKNPLDYANEEREINGEFSLEDLDKDIIFEYEIVLKDLDKIKEKIKELNSLKISIDKIRKNLLFPANKNTANQKKIIPLEFEIKKFIWEDITLKFNDVSDINIYIKNEFVGTYSHEKLGFYKTNTNDKKEDAKWKFLKKISITHGAFDSNRDIDFGKKNIEQINTAKNGYRVLLSDLSKHFKQLFKLAEEPFGCRDGKYTSKFKLEPEPTLRGDGEIYITAKKPSNFL